MVSDCHSVEQYIYIPSGRATVLEIVEGELRYAKVAVKACQGAIKKLNKAAAALAR